MLTSRRRDLMRRHAAWLLLLGAMVGVFYTPQLLGGTVQFDGLDVHYSAQRYLSDALHQGRLPFWTPYVFTGFPFLADLQVGAWYPLNWPFFLKGITPRSMSQELLLHTLIAAGGAYAVCYRLVGSAPAAVAAGIGYGLSGYFAAHSQHVGIVQTAAWLPWLVFLLDHLSERLSLRRLALAGLLGAAIALPGHFQTALYTVVGAGLWALAEAALARCLARARRVVLGLVAVGVWGGLLSAIMILPGLELVGLSVRSQLDPEQVDIGYFHPAALLTLVQPDHYGLLSGHYTGPGDATQHYFYAGIVLVPLALIGVSHQRARRLAILLGGPFLWYALGPAAGLYRLVVRLPGFRAVELPMHGWFLPGLGLAILAGVGCSVVFKRLDQWRWLPPALLLVLFTDVLVFNELDNPLAYARGSFEDLYGARLHALQDALARSPTPVERIAGPPMAAVGYRNHALQSHVETTYGYNPLELASYAAYTDAVETNPRLIDGLAATHRLELATADQVLLQPLPESRPVAEFARAIESVPDAAAAQVALVGLDPARATLVIGPPPAVEPDASASATLLERDDAALVVHVRTHTANLLRVALPTYPGWHASLNGVELPLRPVDLALTGVVVPPGEGDIHLWYVPRLFVPGAILSSLALSGALLALGWRRIAYSMRTISVTSRAPSASACRIASRISLASITRSPT